MPQISNSPELFTIRLPDDLTEILTEGKVVTSITTEAYTTRLKVLYLWFSGAPLFVVKKSTSFLSLQLVE